jgi:hypothetical protein
MPFDKHYLHQSNAYGKNTNKENPVRNIYYGEVVSVDDNVGGRRLKVRIPDFDNKTPDDQLPYSYPIMPMFFWHVPQKGEMVRIFIEDTRFPQRGRHWMGSIISQPQKVGYDGYFTALSTTNVALTAPEAPVSSYPSAKDVFPEISHVALLGRDNTDIILKPKQVLIRAGKHTINNVLELNKKNPAFIQLDFTPTGSSAITMADKIAFISHEGEPKLKAFGIEEKERSKIFSETHPLGRADLIVQAMEVMRDAIVSHLHPYNGMAPDPSGKITELQKIDFTKIMQQNIRIN